MNAPPRVTICVPVCDAVEFVEQTLASIAKQSHPNLEVLVGDDASSDGSAALCREIAREHGFTWVPQAVRLGWVGHCNALLGRASGDFVCIVAHDDVLDERYVEVLSAHLAAHPDCVLAFCDVRGVGTHQAVHTQDSLRGSPFERLHRLIDGHYDGVPFRGLARRDALERVAGLPAHEMDGFAADVGWVARLALEGEIHRVPQVLYLKRYHPESTAARWGDWVEETQIRAWTDHCADLLDLGLRLDLSPAEHWLLVHAALRRLLMITAECRPFPAIRHLPPARRAELVDRLLARLAPEPAPAGGPAAGRRTRAALVVEALSAEVVAAQVRALEASGAARSTRASHARRPAARTLGNWLRFLRRKPLR